MTLSFTFFEADITLDDILTKTNIKTINSDALLKKDNTHGHPIFSDSGLLESITFNDLGSGNSAIPILKELHEKLNAKFLSKYNLEHYTQTLQTTEDFTIYLNRIMKSCFDGTDWILSPDTPIERDLL